MNNTGEQITVGRISANVFTSEGRLLDTQYTFPYVSYLPAGDKTCFRIWFLDIPSNWSYYELEPPHYWSSNQPPSDLVIINDTGTYNSANDTYQIVGQVRSDHNSPVSWIQVVGTLYDHQGSVVDCDFTYPNSYDLEPGQTSAFKLIYYRRGYSDVASYRLQAEGDPQ